MYMIAVLREYFTYTIAAILMVGGNRAVSTILKFKQCPNSSVGRTPPSKAVDPGSVLDRVTPQTWKRELQPPRLVLTIEGKSNDWLVCRSIIVRVGLGDAAQDERAVAICSATRRNVTFALRILSSWYDSTIKYDVKPPSHGSLNSAIFILTRTLTLDLFHGEFSTHHLHDNTSAQVSLENVSALSAFCILLLSWHHLTVRSCSQWSSPPCLAYPRWHILAGYW